MPRLLLRRAPADAGPLLLLTLVLCATTVVLVRYGADAVGGADSAGYFAQAQRWRTGSFRTSLPVPDLPDPERAWLQSPLGFRPSPAADATVPTYPPGWPLLMALALSFGETAAIRVLPGAVALIALAALYVLGRRVTTGWHALAAVVCVASSAPFVFQALQPMSDVPALAAWLVAYAGASGRTRRSLIASGIAAAIAVAVRPNLAPLLLPVLWLAGTPRPSSPGDGPAAPAWTPATLDRRRTPARRHSLVPRLTLVGLPPVLVGCAYVVWQAVLYGSPWQSGYGTADELFALAHVWPNIHRQTAWIVASLGPAHVFVLLLGVGALLNRSWPPALTLAIAIGWGLYLVYVPFDDWTYLRFLLLPLTLLTLAGFVLVDRLSRLQAPWRRAALALALALAAAATNVTRLGPLGVLDLHRREARYPATARVISSEATDNVLVLAGQHSGAVAAYTSLPVLRVDLLSAEAGMRLVPWLQAHGYRIAVALDDEEVPGVRERLAAAGLALDWPPRARVGRPTRTRVWWLDDRARHARGERVTTVPIWPERDR